MYNGVEGEGSHVLFLLLCFCYPGGGAYSTAACLSRAAALRVIALHHRMRRREGLRGLHCGSAPLRAPRWRSPLRTRRAASTPCVEITKITSPQFPSRFARRIKFTFQKQAKYNCPLSETFLFSKGSAKVNSRRKQIKTKLYFQTSCTASARRRALRRGRRLRRGVGEERQGGCRRRARRRVGLDVQHGLLVGLVRVDVRLQLTTQRTPCPACISRPRPPDSRASPVRVTQRRDAAGAPPRWNVWPRREVWTCGRATKRERAAAPSKRSVRPRCGAQVHLKRF